MRPALIFALMIYTFASAASANDDPWQFTVPDGYTLTDGGEAAGSLAQLRANAGEMGSSDARVYVSPDQTVHLVASFLIVRKKDDPTATWVDLEGIDRMLRLNEAETVAGLDRVSSSSHREGPILVSDVTYALDDQRLDKHQLAGFDRGPVVHTFMVMCVGPEKKLAACKAAQQSARLSLRNPVMPTTLPWSVKVPDDYVSFDDGQQAKLQRMRMSEPWVELADIHLYETTDRGRRIVLTGMVTKFDHVATWHELEELEKGTAGGGKRVGKQVSASIRRDGSVLRAAQALDLDNDVHQFFFRFYGVDLTNRVYAVSVMCMGVAMTGTECADVQRSLRVDIPNQRPPIDAPSPTAESPMSAGYWAVFVGLVVALIVLVLYLFSRRRRRRRSRTN